MNLKPLFISMIGVIGIVSTANAADAEKVLSTKPVYEWTCEDFLAVDDDYQPTAVGFAEALNAKGKPEAAVLDVAGIEKVTPMIVDACKQDGKVSFKDKVHSEWQKVKKDM